MSVDFLDSTVVEENFFFTEYAKRRFESSKYNDGQIESIVEDLKPIARDFLKKDIPQGMLLDLLGDAIYFYESIKDNKSCYNISFNGLESLVFYICKRFNLDVFVDMIKVFKVNPVYLPYPLDMKSVIYYFKCNNKLPATYKCSDVSDSISDCGQRRKNELLKEMVRLINKKEFSYENIVKFLYKKSYAKKHRSTLYNVIYKLMGLLLYDLYLQNNFSINDAIMKFYHYEREVKCNPTCKSEVDDCLACNYYAKCKAQWKKYFNSTRNNIRDGSVKICEEKISGKSNMLYRQPVDFDEYRIRIL